MSQLVWRFFKKSLGVQLAITLLFAVSVTLLIVYGTYLEREAGFLHLRMSPGLATDLVRVQQQTLAEGAGKLKAYHGSGPVPVVHLGSWRVELAETNYGHLPVAVVVEDQGLDLALNANEVAIPEVLSAEYNLAVGDELFVADANGGATLKIAGIHGGSIFGNRLVRRDLTSLSSSVYLYRLEAGSITSAIAYLRRTYTNASFEHAGSSRAAAQEIIEAAYSPGKRAQYEAVIFVSIAFLTVTLFSFLTKRKVLAVVKALGLRSREMVGLIAGEAALPPLLGSLLGCSFGYIVLRVLIASGQEFIISPKVFAGAVISIWPAVAVGIAIPARFTQVATVNQLLFERPVPLQTVTIKELGRRIPGLEKFIEQGIKFIKLQVDYGQINGFVFRRLGDYVKQGEVLAVEERWWGLQVVEYLAPLTGQIVYFEEELGIIGVSAEAHMHRA